MKYHSITKSGDIFSLLLTCNHNRTNGMGDEPPYECPPNGGALFYVRAYGPSVISGMVTDFHNSSYSIELQFIDPGEYTLEVVLTFSVPMEFHEFPLDEYDKAAVEPGYEGYMVSGFPLSILVEESSLATTTSSEGKRKTWCTLSQLTESSPISALFKGHWRVVDHVARASHQPLTSDETLVSIDGYRMGLNSIGVRMTYDYEECELIHIRDLVGAIYGGMDSCLEAHLGFTIHGDRGVSRPIDDDENDNDIDTINEAVIAVKGSRRRLAILRANQSDASSIMNATNVDVEIHNNVTAGVRGYNNKVGVSADNGSINGTHSSPDYMRMMNNDVGVINATTSISVDRARADANEIRHIAKINGDKKFEGIHVIFIGDSVMKLVMSFFYKLVERTSGLKVSFIETNGGVRISLNNITAVLEEIQQQEDFRNVKRAIIFNSGLHDIDVLCSSKRSRSRRTQNFIKDGESCQDAYRTSMTDLIQVVDKYPAELKVFRSTTAGKAQTTYQPNIFRACMAILTASYQLLKCHASTPHSGWQKVRHVLFFSSTLYATNRNSSLIHCQWLL